MNHLHDNDLPRHLVVLAHHNCLYGKAHNELLDQEVRMHIRLTLFVHCLKKKKLKAFHGMLDFLQTFIVNSCNKLLSTFSHAEIPTSIACVRRLFTTNKDVIMINVLRTITRMNGDAAAVKIVDVVETFLIMGEDFFPNSNNYRHKIR